MFGFIVWLVIGGVVGWLGSLVTRTRSQHDILTNIVGGTVGGYIGGVLLVPYLRSGIVLNTLSACVGAIAAVAAVSLIRRNNAR